MVVLVVQGVMVVLEHLMATGVGATPLPVMVVAEQEVVAEDLVDLVDLV
jgi:hypothetical protein